MIFQNFLGDVETQSCAALPLFGRKIGIENLAHLRGCDSRTIVLDSNVDVKIFWRAGHRHRTFFFGGSLHRIDDYVLDGAFNLHGLAKNHARVLANTGLQIYSALRCQRIDCFDDFAENCGHGDLLMW